MARKMFGLLSNNFYVLVAILIFIAYVLFRLIMRLIQHHADKQSGAKRTGKSWSSEDLKNAVDAGLVSKKPGWTEAQKRKAKELGLLNNREWTQDEHELARENGLLSDDDPWSHAQFQKAKQLNLI